MPFFVNRSGENLWYEDAGAGAAIVFVHGWCMSSSVWQYQFKSLQSSFRLVAPDLRGHGASRAVPGRLDFKSFANDLSDLLDFLDLNHIVLIGWSMGAQIALQAYREISGRVAGLVLVSATPCFTAKTEFPHGLAPNEAAGMRTKVGRNIHRAVKGFCTRMFAEGELDNLQTSEHILTLLAQIEPPESIAALTALETLAVADMRELLPAIASPTLVVNGDCDKICLPEASSYLFDNIHSAGQKIFPQCGHAPFLSRYDEFNAAIVDFAETVGGRYV